MADVWHIEKVWAIVKERVKAKEPSRKAPLKRGITTVWKEINENVVLCNKLCRVSLQGWRQSSLCRTGRSGRKTISAGGRSKPTLYVILVSNTS